MMEVCWYSVPAAAYNQTSVYLLTSFLLAAGSVLLVWLYERPALQLYFSRNSPAKQTPQPEEELPPEEGEELWGEGGRPLDARSLVEQISAEMTPEQRENERAVEREQLAAIYKLLSEQEDKFQVCSMEQLREQLNLYR